MPATILFARQTRAHLDPVVQKPAQGKPFFGISTSDLSLENAHALAREDSDYVRVDLRFSKRATRSRTRDVRALRPVRAASNLSGGKAGA